MEKYSYIHFRFQDVIEEVEKKFYIHNGEYDEKEFDSDWFDFVNGESVNTGSDSIYFEVNTKAKGLYGLISLVLENEGVNDGKSVYLDLVNWF